jgi:NTE family protein
MRLRVLLSALLLMLLTVGVTSAQEPTAPKRKRIGLVLGGGAALGWAHVGVLEWLEENKIPVDCITGTSFGAMVGGFYASGNTPAEMRILTHSEPWDAFLSGEPYYSDLTFRRKEDRHDFPVKLELGLKNGLRLPAGLDPAHPLGLLLSRYTLAYSDVSDFNALPIPFNTVATDLDAAQSIVLSHGILPRALRASGAIPVIFTPVKIDGRTLVDGGIYDNLPADVARAMHADMLIVVNVTPLTPDAPIPNARPTNPSFLELFVSTLGNFVLSNVKHTLKTLQPQDVLISPDLTNIALEHSNGEAIADRGREAAERNRAALMALRKAAGVDDAAWQEYAAKRDAARAHNQQEFRPRFIKVVEADDPKRIYAQLSGQFSRYVGQPLNKQPTLKKFENDLTTLTGSGRYESLSYEKTTEPGRGEGLRIRVKEKSYGPPFVNLGLDVNNSDTNDVGFTLRGRLTAYDFGAHGAELRNDVNLGSHTLLTSEYFRPLGSGGWFTAPHLFYDKNIRDIVQTDSRVGEYRYERIGAGIDLGYTLNRSSELRFGYELYHAGTTLRSGDPMLPLYNGETSVGTIRWTLDRQDRALVPTHGIKIVTVGSWYFNAPGLGGRTLPQFEATLSAFTPLDRQQANLLFGIFGTGTSFGNHALPLQAFALGGPFRLGGYTRNLFQGSSYLYGNVGYLHRVAQFLPSLGGRVYLGGWVESGGAFEDTRHAQYHTSVTSGLVAETFLGTAFAGGSLTQQGTLSLYFALGRLF